MSGSEKLDRRSLVDELLRHRGDTAVIAGLGSSAWDCHAAGDSDLNFYLWGAMGGAAMIGLGLALAQPDRRVLVITGDGEMMMGIGSLSVIAAQAPPNLTILILDNEAFGETGQQMSLTRGSANIAGIARGAGIARAFTVPGEGDRESLVSALLDEDGPIVCVAKVALTDDPDSWPPRDGPHLHQRFRSAVLGSSSR